MTAFDVQPQPTDPDRFELISPIGAGAFGRVFRAADRKTRRQVALKIMTPEAADDPDLVARFQREIAISAALDHPGIVRFMGSGLLGDVPYIAFELVPGAPLGQLLTLRGKLRPNEVIHVLAQVLDALEVAHRMGVVHRDLKPDNILVVAPPKHWVMAVDDAAGAARLGIPGDDSPLWQDLSTLKVKVIDFGLGKFLPSAAQEDDNLTAAGFCVGTPEYMSPEEITDDKHLDHRSDLYSCAMLMYRMLTGEPPYTGKTIMSVAYKQVREALPELPMELPHAVALASVYARAGAKKAKHRYGSAAQMAWALRGITDKAVRAQPEPDPGELLHLAKRGLFSRLLGR